MENNKKVCLTEDVSLHNNTNLVNDSKEGLEGLEKDAYEVKFHSDFINEKVGNLDITV